MRPILKNTLFIAIGAVAGVVITWQVTAVAQQNAALPLEELRLFTSVFGSVKREYVEPIEDKKLLTDAVKGMVNSLDPHSAFLDTKDFSDMQEQTQGRFAGLGIEISSEDGLVKVMNPIEDSPAAKAGIQSGDLITRLDDKPVRGMTLDQAVRKMRGAPGTKITLTIYRKSEERTFPITITRAEIKVQSVKSKLIDNAILWVRITSFQERTVPDLAKRLTEAYQANPDIKGVVLDLRNNGGGILQGAVGVSAAFLPSGSTIVSTKGQSASSKQVYKAEPANYRLSEGGDALSNVPAIFKKIPLVVLTNAYSASASEIVSGALQDLKRATIMGKTTFGKGSVQTVRQITSDTALKITTAYYYTPNGRSIQAYGIKPDIAVDQNPEGDPYDVLITREIDSENHLKNKQKAEDQVLSDREKRRMAELQALEEKNALMTPEDRLKEKSKKLPEFGSVDDFMLQQAKAYLLGQTFIRSKSKLE
ncbi:MAG: S41 family peptidase [Polynucleobacter sp.]|jgi:carboxyl-terminal processing protease|nr:S41 family peptidase [Polynucleobacter sp.]